jgi:aspartyl-tRNA(Asn)/glutamyl-tRNA(Gln) amidotransferase subunit C
MKITPAEVRTTAALARLAVTDDEVERLTRELDGILGYMERLSALDVEGIEPMTHAVALDCALRDDEPGPQLGSEVALAGAPRHDGPFFVVPRVIAHDKET